MTERPILFSTDMVQALLAGTKTMTRRVVKGLPENATPELVQIMVSGHHAEHGHVICPYGKVGDRLWVRETWQYHYNMVQETILHEPELKNIVFKADQPVTSLMLDEKWKPSIRLRKEHSRIWLEVSSVKVERLYSISEGDAKAEGLPIVTVIDNEPLYKNYRKGYTTTQFPTFSFQTLWESINGKNSWVANPYVWVISFKVLSTTGKPQA